MDKLDAMRVFVRVVETGSFTRAAQSMHMSRTSVTQLVQQLEARLRVKLLHRTTRKVNVTADGAAYYERVLRVLADVDDAETSLSRFAATRRQLARLASAEQSASRAAALNRQRVEAGTSTLIDQLDVERQRLSAAMAVAQAKAQLTNSFVAVNKALGLGWAPVAGGEQPGG